VLAAHHARLKELLDAGLTVVRAGNCSPATVWSCRGDDAPVCAGRAGPGPGAEAGGSGGQPRTGRRLPGREDGPAGLVLESAVLTSTRGRRL